MRKLKAVTATLVLSVTLFFMPHTSCLAQTAKTSSRTFGLGIQAAPFPIFGPAITYNPSRTIGLQAFGITEYDNKFHFLAARALYRFVTKPRHSFYVSGLIGTFKEEELNTNPLLPIDETDTPMGYGAGAGIAWYLSSKRNIELNLEIDFIYIDYEKKWWQYDYEAFKLVMLGLGAHYYF